MAATLGEIIMNINILLSIIIPAYNVERFITRTLEMLISQNLDECEVIVVNDGSKDKTLEIAQKIAEKDSHIKVFTQENKGVSVARNAGMQKASGKFIYFMDSDDMLTEETLEFWRKLLHEKPDLKMYGFGYKSISGGKEKKYVYKDFDKQKIENPLLKQIFLTKKICFHICSCIYESKFLRENDLQFTPGLKIGEDVEFILKALDKTDYLYYDARECFVYLIRDDSAMQGYKTFSENQFHSYEVRRDICLSTEFQNDDMKKYSNFWLQNQYVSSLASYLKSDFKDKEINRKFIVDSKYLKLPSINGAFKNTLAIKIAKLLPLKFILKVAKGEN